MVVFHIISHFELGGAEKVAFNIASSPNKDIEYHIIEVAKGESEYTKNFLQYAKEQGIITHQSQIRNVRKAILHFPFWFSKLVRKYNPDIIHCHTETPDLAVYLSLKSGLVNRTKHKIVRTIHNNQLWNSWKGIGAVVEKYFKTRSEIIAISHSTQNSYKEQYGLAPDIIFNGIKVPLAKKFPNLDKDKINILFAGRLEYQKGIDVLLRVIESLNDINNIHFYIVGNGTMKNSVLDSISNLNNVTYYPQIFGLADYLNSFDYIFLPSLFEGLALTTIEASMSGTPAIINSAPGLEETLPPDWPLKVIENNVAAYLQIIKNLQFYNYEDLKQNAHQYAVKNFNLSSMQTAYENIYIKLCKN